MRGAGAQRNAELMEKIVSGDLLIALAVDERAKHRPREIAMEARRSGNGYTLTGSKTFVVDGHVADRLVVAARTAGAPGETAGLTLFSSIPRSKASRSNER